MQQHDAALPRKRAMDADERELAMKAHKRRMGRQRKKVLDAKKKEEASVNKNLSELSAEYKSLIIQEAKKKARELPRDERWLYDVTMFLVFRFKIYWPVAVTFASVAISVLSDERLTK